MGYFTYFINGVPWGSNPLTYSSPKRSRVLSPGSEAEIPIEQRGDEEVKYAEAKRKVFGGMVFEEGGCGLNVGFKK